MGNRTFKDRQHDRNRRARVGKKSPNLLTPDEGIEAASSEKVKRLIQSFKGAPMVIDTKSVTVFSPYNGTIRLARNDELWGSCEDAEQVPFPKAANVGNPMPSRQTLKSKRGDVLAVIAMNPFLTALQISKIVGRSLDSVFQDIRYLKSTGLIGRCDKWVINPYIVGKGKPFIPLRTKKKRNKQDPL